MSVFRLSFLYFQCKVQFYSTWVIDDASQSLWLDLYKTFQWWGPTHTPRIICFLAFSLPAHPYIAVKSLFSFPIDPVVWRLRAGPGHWSPLYTWCPYFARLCWSFELEVTLFVRMTTFGKSGITVFLGTFIYPCNGRCLISIGGKHNNTCTFGGFFHQ